ncbi:hypothetical protein NDU88_002061 [Pleurodeles waltl]|uniref:Reverse transcriptase domain-containing protein n=1 Tax=Pleurodeles waltl TaxID=8319 RepID=A0AAV7UUH4_PLEWA|nr:hypothetical protein NDU88_002061 [Pleurodeles waltl]
MKPFAQGVRDSPEITRAIFGSEEYTVALYADDMMVALDNPIRALPAFLSEVEAFGKVSGFWINLSKSQALSLALLKETVDSLAQLYPLHWQAHSISYFGIKIASTVTESSKSTLMLEEGYQADESASQHFCCKRKSHGHDFTEI